MCRMEQRMIKILKKCRNFRELKQTHVQILASGLGESKYLIPKLIDLSSAFQSLHYAIEIFEHSQKPNVVVFNTMMKCFIEKNHQNEAFMTYKRMRVSEILPNNFTFTFLLKACESLDSLKGSSEIHAQIVKCGFGCYLFVQNALLSVYSSCCKELDLVHRLFDEMPERDVVTWNSLVGAYMARGNIVKAVHYFELMPARNLVSWNTMITGLCRAGDMASARKVFDQMTTKDSVSWNAMITGYVNCNDVASARSIFDRMEDKDVVSWTAMLSGYTRIGDLESARKLFDRMPVKNVVSWNAMISGYSQNAQFDEALCMFQRMLLDGKFQPDEATLVSVVSACAQLGSLDHGNWVHSYIKKNSINITLPLGNSLVDMFEKCGDINNAELVFFRMETKSIITWTTMVSGFAFNGQCREALACFERMCSERVEPDDVIFIAVLSACSHGGLVKEGQEMFDRMVDQHGIKPRMEHYGCMVDLLGRAGKLEGAIRVIESMTIEPGVVIWAALLSYCTMHGAMDLVELVSRKIRNLEPLDPGYRVLVSNSSARKGRWDGVEDVRAAMRREGIEKVPGCSSIQVGREVHEFLVKDTRHRRRKVIYEVLDGLTNLMKRADCEQEWNLRG